MHSICLFIVFLWSIYLELLCVFKIFTIVIFSSEPDLRTGRLLVFLLCWVRFGILFRNKIEFIIPWITILLFFRNSFQMKEKVGRKRQGCLYVFHRKFFIISWFHISTFYLGYFILFLFPCFDVILCKEGNCSVTEI